MVTMTVGVVLTLVGIIGFFVGEALLGLFALNTLHNLVHLLSGVVAIVMAMNGMAALYNKIFGSVYIVVTILGFVAPGLVISLLTAGGDVNLLPDNLLHLALGLVLVGVGFGVKEE